MPSCECCVFNLLNSGEEYCSMGLLQTLFDTASDDCDEYEVIPSLPEELK